MFDNKGSHTLHFLQVHFSSFQDFISVLKTSSFLDYVIFPGEEYRRRQDLKRSDLTSYVIV